MTPREILTIDEIKILEQLGHYVVSSKNKIKTDFTTDKQNNLIERGFEYREGKMTPEHYVKFYPKMRTIRVMLDGDIEIESRKLTQVMKRDIIAIKAMGVGELK